MNNLVTEDVDAPTAAAHRTVRSARWAWIAFALLPLTALLGVGVAFGAAIIAGIDMDNMSTIDNWVVGVPTALVILTAPAIGLIAAVGAVRSGNRSGLTALVAWVAVLLLALINFIR